MQIRPVLSFLLLEVGELGDIVCTLLHDIVSGDIYRILGYETSGLGVKGIDSSDVCIGGIVEMLAASVGTHTLGLVCSGSRAGDRHIYTCFLQGVVQDLDMICQQFAGGFMNLIIVQETVTKLPKGIHDEFGFCHISFCDSGVRIEICPDKIDERLGSLLQIIGIAAFLSDEFGKTLSGPHTQVALDVLDLVCGFGVARLVQMSQEYKHVKAKKIAKRSPCVIREDSSVFVYFIRISDTFGNGVL